MLASFCSFHASQLIPVTYLYPYYLGFFSFGLSCFLIVVLSSYAWSSPCYLIAVYLLSTCFRRIHSSHASPNCFPSCYSSYTLSCYCFAHRYRLAISVCFISFSVHQIKLYNCIPSTYIPSHLASHFINLEVLFYNIVQSLNEF
jgi:hypothetical protein